MNDLPSKPEIAELARRVGLTLTDEYLDQLVSAYTNVRTLIAAMPTGRPRGDEPGHIFDPNKFLPAKE